MNMKKLPLCICLVGLLAIVAQAQPPPPPPPPPLTSPSPVASVSATASVSPGSLADKIHQKLDKKLHGHHGIVIDGDKGEDVDLGKISDLGERMAVPIVGIVFMTIFGAPVLIVAVIMYFGFS